MKRFDYLISVMACVMFAGCSQLADLPEQENLTQYVNPMIGTGDHGHVFLGANVPFGFVQLGPSQHVRGWDWCSGYHYSDSVIVGFSHTHLSGTGIGELGDVTFFPSVRRDVKESLFSHSEEVAKPGYYSVSLPDAGVNVELTATARTGMHRYVFDADADTAFVSLDLAYGIGWDKMTECGISVDNDSTLSGYRYSTGWAKNQKIYFAAVFSQPMADACVTDSTAVCAFSPVAGKPLMLKVGISAVSVDGARANLAAENPGWDFDAVALQADSLWNAGLNRVKVSGGTDEQKRVFYTAMYHAMFSPSVFGDVDGAYRGADGEIHKADGFTNYTIFSLWDTYRAAHPFYLLAFPDMQADIANTFVNIYNQQGKLPVWHLVGNETDCMIGNPAIPVLANIAVNGFGIDEEAAYQAMRASAMLDERSMGLLKQYGYIPYDLEPTNETAAKGLEYAVADACVALMAERLGHKDDAEYFSRRAQSYRKYFDKETGFMRGLGSDGRFSEPFDPFHSEPMKGDYTEGNAWQYAWLVPHDVHGLVELFGGEESFVAKLDSLFVVEGDFGENVAPDLTGLIGQYVHGNEPSHHIIYMYNYVGMPWKAAPLLRKVMSELYADAPAGLCGNEDVGQMSAWYVLSAMGLYQVEPAGGKFIIGSPLFDSVTVDVGGGKVFSVKATGNSAENIYVQSASLNGRPYTKSYIMYSDIRDGGVLELIMGPEPSDTWGVEPEDRP